MRSNAAVSEAWAPERLLESPVAMDAIATLGRRLRDTGFVNRFGSLQIDDPSNADLAEFALGRWIDVVIATEILGGPPAARALIESGAALLTDDDQLSLAFEVISDGRAMAILPFLPPDGSVGLDTVYAGPDTWLLRDRAWEYGLRGRRAADLGTGTGLVANFLTSRFDSVVATDINPRCTATASISRALLPESSRSRLQVITTDIAADLDTGSFDFVCANAPWVPEDSAHGRVYADGGPTGFELPRRFITEGARLLASGGVLAVLCARLVFTDGRDPLGELLDELTDEGFACRMEPTPPSHPFHDATGSTTDPVRDLDHAQHVTVIIHRPAEPEQKRHHP